MKNNVILTSQDAQQVDKIAMEKLGMAGEKADEKSGWICSGKCL